MKYGTLVRPITLEEKITSWELEGKARAQDTSPDLREVLGPCVQYCTCEASEQKLGQKPKSKLKEIWGEGGNRHFRHFRHRVLAIFKFLE